MKQREWLLLSILTFLIVAVWVTLEIYHTYTSTTITQIDKALTKPLATTFDHDTVIKLLEEN